MGQYYVIVNLDKQEFVHPHEIGSGLKAWEIGANQPFGWAMSILLVNSPDVRGGGDFRPATEGIVGRWAGDRIALIGDYAEATDMPNVPEDVSTIYHACDDDAGTYRNISEAVRLEIEAQFQQKYDGSGLGWGRWQDA